MDLRSVLGQLPPDVLTKLTGLLGAPSAPPPPAPLQPHLSPEAMRIFNSTTPQGANLAGPTRGDVLSPASSAVNRGSVQTSPELEGVEGELDEAMLTMIPTNQGTMSPALHRALIDGWSRRMTGVPYYSPSATPEPEAEEAPEPEDESAELTDDERMQEFLRREDVMRLIEQIRAEFWARQPPPR